MAKINRAGGQVETGVEDAFLAVLQPILAKDEISRQRRSNGEFHVDQEDAVKTGKSKQARSNRVDSRNCRAGIKRQERHGKPLAGENKNVIYRQKAQQRLYCAEQDMIRALQTYTHSGCPHECIYDPSYAHRYKWLLTSIPKPYFAPFQTLVPYIYPITGISVNLTSGMTRNTDHISQIYGSGTAPHLILHEEITAVEGSHTCCNLRVGELDTHKGHIILNKTGSNI
ncbi:hypothetical protein DFH09DRAFT_1097867 [Mycena vulgaris]|nr:hypothetical protein DFH09DRAFT_1097867 [Mycena vulgaris]